MSLRNTVFSAWETRGVAYGTFIQNNSPENCEIAAGSGLDYVIVDMEHGSFGIESAADLIRAAEARGVSAIVRIPEYTRATVLKVLDAGAAGIIVPNVESAELMREVVAATRYAPHGTRGACPCTRSTVHGILDWQQSVDWAEKNILVVGLVETKAGIDNFDEIIAVEGLHVVGVGQFDLSMSLGYAGDHQHPEVQRKQREMNAKALARGVDVMGASFDTEPELVRSAVDGLRSQGVRFIALTGDRFALSAAYRKVASALELR